MAAAAADTQTRSLELEMTLLKPCRCDGTAWSPCAQLDAATRYALRFKVKKPSWTKGSQLGKMAFRLIVLGAANAAAAGAAQGGGGGCQQLAAWNQPAPLPGVHTIASSALYIAMGRAADMQKVTPVKGGILTNWLAISGLCISSPKGDSNRALCQKETGGLVVNVGESYLLQWHAPFRLRLDSQELSVTHSFHAPIQPAAPNSYPMSRAVFASHSDEGQELNADNQTVQTAQSVEHPHYGLAAAAAAANQMSNPGDWMNGNSSSAVSTPIINHSIINHSFMACCNTIVQQAPQVITTVHALAQQCARNVIEAPTLIDVRNALQMISPLIHALHEFTSAAPQPHQPPSSPLPDNVSQNLVMPEAGPGNSLAMQDNASAANAVDLLASPEIPSQVPPGTPNGYFLNNY